MNAEQAEIIGTFLHLLRGPTEDGATKREANTKPLWKVDTDHWDAANRHMRRWENGEHVDETSGCHPLAHAGWRLLALAAQDLHYGEPGWIGGESEEG